MSGEYEREVRKIARVLADVAHVLESADHVVDRVERTLALMRELVPYRHCALLEVRPCVEPRLIVVPEVAGAERAGLRDMLVRIFRFVAEAEEIGRSPGTNSHLVLPVMGLDRVIGVVRVEPPPDTTYDARHLRLLSVVAAQLGAYLTMLQLREEQALRTAELERAHEFQQLLAGVVSHDLRNPLSVITTVASMLLEQTTDAKQARNIERALWNAERASRIINDLLDVTNARVSGHLSVIKQRSDVGALLRELIDDLRLEHGEIELIVTSREEPALADFDSGRLSQLAANLVSNARQHGERGTPVRVALRVEADEIVLSVHNQGPPIEASLLPLIFDPFKQGAGGRHRPAGGGLGLGLYIVDQIARSHGGRVEARSTAADGTTFTATLPRWDEDAVVSGPPQPSPEAAMHHERPLILVVDDEADIRDGIATILEHHGFDVDTAEHGGRALELLRSGLEPALILLDLRMPVMDGTEFYEACRADPKLSQIPIIVISADAASAVKLTRSGPSTFLQKPVPVQTLLAALEGFSRVT